MSYLVQVFVRYPRPGQVKTRLIPELGAQRACYLQIALLNDLFLRLDGVVDCELWGTESAVEPQYALLRKTYRLAYRRQTEGDLGQRMEAAVTSALLRGKVPVLVGADCPLMSAAVIREIIIEMEAGSEAVMVPAEDGGYVALGLSRKHHSPFRGIAWGSADVAVETLRSIIRTGMSYRVLDPLFDIDTAQDLDRLADFAGQEGHPMLTAWLNN